MNGNEPVTPTVLGEGGPSWRPTAVGLTHILALPQGFTLAIAGSLAICLGRQGYPGPPRRVALRRRSLRRVLPPHPRLRRPAPHGQPTVGIVGLGLLDVTAVVVVPLVALGSWWIPNADLAYLATGLAVHLTYIPLVAGTMVLLSQGTAAFGHEPMTCPSGLDRKNVPDQPLSATTDLSPGGGVSGHW